MVPLPSQMMGKDWISLQVVFREANGSELSLMCMFLTPMLDNPWPVLQKT